MNNIITLCLWLCASSFSAQDQEIGIIDFYGLRTVSVKEARAALGIHEGTPLSVQSSELVKRLEHIPQVALAQIEVVCCDAGKLILYAGIEERGASHYDYRTPSGTDIKLPPEIDSAYDNFMNALREALRKGESGDDVSQGHSLVANPEARRFQEQFLVFARRYTDTLRIALRTSSHASERAIAAQVLGYIADKRLAVDDLLYAVSDPDDEVRNNATRALGAIAVLAQDKPGLGITISALPFIRMLNSVVWTDRRDVQHERARFRHHGD